MASRLRRVHLEPSLDEYEPRGRPLVADFMILSLCAALIALLGRLAYIEAAMAPELRPLASRQHAGFQPIHARRGLILDRHGRILAGSEQGHSVFVDPTRITDPIDTVRQIAPILGLSVSEVTAQVAERVAKVPHTAYVRIARHVEHIEADAIRDLALAGVGIETDPRRRYPMGKLAGHVLGFVGADGDGLEGVERLFDERLAGKHGGIEGVKDARGRWIWTRPGSYRAPRDGGHVVLTLDAAIQSLVEVELRKGIEAFQALSGVAIVMDPRTGQVLALSCDPGFDPNDWQEAPAETRRNRALTDPIEPGSTFKPFIAASAVHEGVVTWDEAINCHQGIYFMPGRSKPIGDMHPYGYLPFEMVIVKSSNIGMAIIGGRMGNERLHRAVRSFGFGEPTGIELPGEDAGLVRDLAGWTEWSTGSIPFGQEISVTPIQLARAYCALVNGGRLLRPRVVKAVLDVYGDVVHESTEPIEVGQVLSESVLRSTVRVLTRVVTEGTARNVALKRWTMLAKTGTPQVARRDGKGYKSNEWIPSFACAAPASDPQAVVVVMIHCRNRGLGSNGYTGGRVSGPVAKAIMAQTLGYLGVPPDQEPEPGRALTVGTASGRP